MASKTHRSAFSLLEALAVVVILGILALIVVSRINFSSAIAKENSCFQNKAEINAAVERYRFENDSLPNNVNALDVPAYFPGGVPKCPVSGGNYALSGATKRVSGHTAGSH